MTEQANSIPEKFKRYAKQIRFGGVGVQGQQRLSESRIVVIGCGALGSVSANLLARAGVGQMLIVDRDFVELDNLQRQVLYDEADVGMPKAVVAAEKLRGINSEIQIESKVADVDYRNIESLLMSPVKADAIIDGTDNFEIRFLINDAAIKFEIPWVYGGCLGAEGQAMAVLPGETGCLGCLMPDGPPAPGTTQTCDTGGILSTIVNVVASFQANETLKLLSGQSEKVNRKLQDFDLWNNRMHQMDLSGVRGSEECRVCNKTKFEWLEGRLGSQSVALCGRNAVQVSFPDRKELSLEQLAKQLQHLGELTLNPYLLRFQVDGYIITAFKDGRAIIGGTDDIATAKKLYAQYLGA